MCCTEELTLEGLSHEPGHCRIAPVGLRERVVPSMDGSSHLQFSPRGASPFGSFLPALCGSNCASAMLGTTPILLLTSQDRLGIEGSEARQEALGCSALVKLSPPLRCRHYGRVSLRNGHQTALCNPDTQKSSGTSWPEVALSHGLCGLLEAVLFWGHLALRLTYVRQAS